VATDRYTYDAFGVLLNSVGTTVNTHLFLGEQFDQNLGFIDLRARDMSPEMGRFVSRDPFPASLIEPISINRYDYAGANPVNRTDPTGLDFLDLGSFSVAQACQGILASIGFGVGLTYGRVKGKSWGTSIEYALCGAAIGYGMGTIAGRFIPVASAPAVSSTPLTDSFIAQETGGAGVQSSGLATQISNAFKPGGGAAIALTPQVIGLVAKELGAPQGYSVLAVARKAIRDLYNESAGDPTAQEFYKTFLDQIDKQAPNLPQVDEGTI
jgi:RHS repeat-associated protein